MNPAARRVASARENPFVVQRTDALPFDFRDTPFANINEFFEHVAGAGFRGAIVGKHGQGKTTLLCDLHSLMKKRDQDCELIFVPSDRSEQKAVIQNLIDRGCDGAVLLIDGLERVPFFARHHLVSSSKQFAGFIATTHFRGRLRTLVHCQSSPETLVGILQSLGTANENLVSRALDLWANHRGNVRSVLRDLYDLRAEGSI